MEDALPAPTTEPAPPTRGTTVWERPAELVVPDRRSERLRSRRTTDRPDEKVPSKKSDRRRRGANAKEAKKAEDLRLAGPSINGRPIMDFRDANGQDAAKSDALSDGLDHFSTRERRVFHGQVMVARQIALGLLILLVTVIDDLPNRMSLVACLGGLWLVGGAYQIAHLKIRDGLPTTLPWLDCLANLAMLAVAPRALPMILVLGFAQLSVAVVAYGSMHAFFAATCLTIGVPFISFTAGNADPTAVITVAAFGVFVPVIAAVLHRIRTLEQGTQRRYLDLMGGLDTVVWEADPETLEICLVGPQVRFLFGVEPEDFPLRYPELVHPDDREMEAALRRGGIENGEESFSVESRMIDKNGDMISVRNVIAVDHDGDGKRTRIRGVITDVTRQQEAEATIRKQAQYDSLTGLPNRSLFNEQLRRRLEDSRRTGDELAVLILDLNGFKEVNDTLGHAVGDQLLQAIAGRLAAYMPERSTVARLGGDEFAVVLSPASARAAASIAETIASCLQPPITVDDMTIQAGASTGIALYPSDGETPAALMRRADAAMYEAKQSGRTHMFATPDDDQANMRRLQLLGELRASITTGDFRLYHQPKVDLKTGRIVGTEGLIRWNHRQFGLLSPNEFVELSELSGLIQPLTRWILDRGIRDLSEWRAKGFELTVALNLSVRNFFDQTLPTYIAQLLADYNVPGDQLTLEITESEVMADRALARTALSAFRSLGVKIAIDDFGTGFSSLSQLQQLPIDEIKVDQSFVSGMIDNPQDAVIVRSIIDLGHNLGLEIVAEGAEDEVQLAALRSLGADRAQGYVISRPLPPDEFIPWLERMERGEGTSASSTVPGAGRFHRAEEALSAAQPIPAGSFANGTGSDEPGPAWTVTALRGPAPSMASPRSPIDAPALIPASAPGSMSGWAAETRSPATVLALSHAPAPNGAVPQVAPAGPESDLGSAHSQPPSRRGLVAKAASREAGSAGPRAPSAVAPPAASGPSQAPAALHPRVEPPAPVAAKTVALPAPASEPDGFPDEWKALLRRPVESSH